MLPALLSASGEQASLPPAFNAVVQAVLAATGLPNSLGGLTLTVVTMMVLRSLLLGAALTYAGFAIANVSTRMREDLLQAMFTTRWRYFVQHRAGAVANTISVDATRAGQAYLESARFIAGIIQATGYFIIGLMASVKFAFAGVIIGVVLIASLGKLIAVSRGAGAQQVDSTRDLVTLVADALNNIKPIKSMARTAPFIAMFGHNLVRLNKSIKTQVLAAQSLERGTDILIALLVGISFYVGVSVFDISLAALAVTAAIGFQAFTVVRRMQGYLQRASELEAAYSSVENIYRELEREKERQTGDTDISLARAISFNDVSFAHGDEPTVRNVNLEIPAGRITVLQGPSGAGKTTLVDLLLGLHEPGSGEITIDGRPLGELSLNAWRSMVGYVPQELQLLHASLRDNIALGEQLGDEQLLRALDLAHARSFIESLPEGLDTNAGEMGGRLSGGQRQRIALARALVGAPKLLILDEVTSALDPKTEASICETAQQLAGDYTIIAITHRPAWSRIADRLYRIEAGQASEITAAKPGRRSRKATGK
jgi:ATP-binding cassette subfamily C protein